MQKGKQISAGRTADIFTWGEDKILKLYKPGFTFDMAKFEYQTALASEKTGYAVPKVYELVKVDGRPGIIYQRVTGITMLEAFIQDPFKVFLLSRQLAELHLDMHQHQVDDLPPYREYLKRTIKRAALLTEVERTAVLAYLDTLPEDEKLCHADFHPENVMMTADGPIIIDWITAVRGHPLGDVARTYVISYFTDIPKETPNRLILFIGRWLYIQEYLRTYFKHSPYTRAQMEAWLLPVAASRLAENIPEAEAPLLRIVQNKLHSI
jgi:uncharacterized protein (TIGR02172 family)